MDDHRDDKHEETELEKKDSVREEKKSDDSGGDYEDVCFICRRPESKAGKMFRLPNHICVCDDCMHKTMDTVSQFDYQGLLNNPNMGDMNGKGFPEPGGPAGGRRHPQQAETDEKEEGKGGGD